MHREQLPTQSETIRMVRARRRSATPRKLLRKCSYPLVRPSMATPRFRSMVSPVVGRELGRGEAHSTTAYYLPVTKDLFVGDAVINRLHAPILEAASGSWLGILDRLETTFPDARTVHPGHGASGPPSTLYEDERVYLRTCRKIAAEEIARSGFTEAGEKLQRNASTPVFLISILQGSKSHSPSTVVSQIWCESTYNDLENRWLESMPSEYIASYKSTYRC